MIANLVVRPILVALMLPSVWMSYSDLTDEEVKEDRKQLVGRLGWVEGVTIIKRPI